MNESTKDLGATEEIGLGIIFLYKMQNQQVRKEICFWQTVFLGKLWNLCKINICETQNLSLRKKINVVHQQGKNMI